MNPPPHRGTFLRNLAATQWEKRRSKHLSQPRLSSSDDVMTPSPQPAAESGGGVAAEERRGKRSADQSHLILQTQALSVTNSTVTDVSVYV